MGLDQMLYKRKYLAEGQKLVEKIKKVEEENPGLFQALLQDEYQTFEKIFEDKLEYVEHEAAYWRKANQIHRWFLDHAPEDYDENTQNPIFVNFEDLVKLRNLCRELLRDLKTKKDEKGNRVILNQDLAEEKLPTMSGFFFGSTEYDEWYLQDLEETIKMLDPIIQDGSIWGTDFVYRMSW